MSRVMRARARVARVLRAQPLPASASSSCLWAGVQAFFRVPTMTGSEPEPTARTSPPLCSACQL